MWRQHSVSRLSTFPCLLQAPCVPLRLSPVLRALSCWASTGVLPASGRQMSPTPRLPAYAPWIPTSGTSSPGSRCGAVPWAPIPFSSPSWDPTWDPPGSPQLRSLCPGRGQLWHKEGPRDTSEVKGTEGDFSQTVIRVVSTLWDAGRGYSWSRRVVLGHHRQVLLPSSGPCPAP